MSIQPITTTPVSSFQQEDEIPQEGQEISSETSPWIDEKYQALPIHLLDQVCLTMEEKIQVFLKQNKLFLKELPQIDREFSENITSQVELPRYLHQILFPFQFEALSQENEIPDHHKELESLQEDLQETLSFQSENSRIMQELNNGLQQFPKQKRLSSNDMATRRSYKQKFDVCHLFDSFCTLSREMSEGITLLQKKWPETPQIPSESDPKQVNKAFEALLKVHDHFPPFFNKTFLQRLNSAGPDKSLALEWHKKILEHSSIYSRQFLGIMNRKTEKIPLLILSFFQQITSFCLASVEFRTVSFQNPGIKDDLLTFQMHRLHSMLKISDLLGLIQQKTCPNSFGDYLDFFYSLLFLLKDIQTSPDSQISSLLTKIKDKLDLSNNLDNLDLWIDLSANAQKLFQIFDELLNDIEAFISNQLNSQETNVDHLMHLDPILDLLTTSLILSAGDPEKHQDKTTRLFEQKKRLDQAFKKISASQKKPSTQPEQKLSAQASSSLAERQQHSSYVSLNTACNEIASSEESLSLSQIQPNHRTLTALDKDKIKTFHDAETFLQILGYRYIRTSGSHHMWSKESSRICLPHGGKTHKLFDARKRHNYLFKNLQNALDLFDSSALKNARRRSQLARFCIHTGSDTTFP